MALQPSSPARPPDLAASGARRSLRIAVLLLLVVVVLAASTVFFAGGTLRLPYLPDFVLEQINARLGGYRIASEKGRIAWTPATGEVGATFLEAGFEDPSGEVFATAESIDISARGSLFAEDPFLPHRAEITGVSADFLTTAENQTFLLSPAGERLPVAALLALLGDTDETGPESVSLRRGRISWRREPGPDGAAEGVLRLEADWRADGRLKAQIAFDALPLSLVAPVLPGDIPADGQFSIVLEADRQSASLSGIAGFRARDLAAALTSAGSSLSGPVSLDVEARLDLSPDGEIDRVSGKLAVREREILAAERGVIEVIAAETFFAVDPKAKRVELTGARLASSEAAFEGEAEFTYGSAGLEGRAEFRDAWLSPLMPVGEEMLFDRVSAEVVLDPARGVWEISNGRAAAKGLDAVFRARGEGPDLEAKISIPETDLASVLNLWPADVAPDVRESILRNVKRGRLAIDLSVSGPRSDPEHHLEFTFSEVDVEPGAGFPDIRSGRGSVRLQKDSLEIVLARGLLDLQEILPTWAGSEFSEAEIAVRMEGGLDAIRGRGDSALDIGGVVRMTLPAVLGGWMLSGGESSFELQLAEGTGEAAEFVLRADLSALDVAYQGLPMKEPGTRGELVAKGAILETGVRLSSVEVEIEQSRVFVRYPESPEGDGPIQITGHVGPSLLSGLGSPLREAAPLEAQIVRRAGDGFEFSALLDMTDTHFLLPGTSWSKPAGVPGEIRLSGSAVGGAIRLGKFSFETESLSVVGEWQEGDGSEPGYLRLEKIRIGKRTKVAVRAGSTDENEYWGRIVGGTIDVDDLGELTTVPDSGPESPIAEVGIRVTGDLQRFHMAEGLWLEEARGRFHLTAPGQSVGSVEGRMFGKLPARLSLKTEPGEEDQIRLEVEDAGEVLRGLGILRNVHGGRVTLVSVAEDTLQVPGETYWVSMEDIRVRNSPLYAKMLSFLSGIGLIEYLVLGETHFSRAELYVTEEGDLLRLRGGRVEGASIGVVFAGDYDTASDQVEIRGYATPVRFFTRILGLLPGLGLLFEDESGIASFGVGFHIFGSLGDVELEFEPLTALVPFLPRFSPPTLEAGADFPQRNP